MGGVGLAAYKKNAARTRVHIVFVGETGLLMLPTVRRTWAPRGQTPILRDCARGHRKSSAIGSLTISPRRRQMGLYLHRHPNRNIAADEGIWCPCALLGSRGKNVILVWDWLNAHRRARVRLWRSRNRRLTIEWLPLHAPELDPTEYVWSRLKYHRLSNHGLCELQAIQNLTYRLAFRELATE